MRNYDDLECMACPAKYRELQTFYKYYSGRAQAPYPTLFSEWRRMGAAWLQVLPAALAGRVAC